VTEKGGKVRSEKGLEGWVKKERLENRGRKKGRGGGVGEGITE